ncbi:hypothetical protein AB0M83_32210 [Amycolatopsis sp. NPDC051106]|uniref:hypothetical protein n=1 Tax=unclassified Amycolatopsis TaxID=2618356 RepID=UPI0034393A3E
MAAAQAGRRSGLNAANPPLVRAGRRRGALEPGNGRRGHGEDPLHATKLSAPGQPDACQGEFRAGDPMRTWACGWGALHAGTLQPNVAKRDNESVKMVLRW